MMGEKKVELRLASEQGVGGPIEGAEDRRKRAKLIGFVLWEGKVVMMRHIQAVREECLGVFVFERKDGIVGWT